MYRLAVLVGIMIRSQELGPLHTLLNGGGTGLVKVLSFRLCLQALGISGVARMWQLRCVRRELLL